MAVISKTPLCNHFIYVFMFFQFELFSLQFIIDVSTFFLHTPPLRSFASSLAWLAEKMLQQPGSQYMDKAEPNGHSSIWALCPRSCGYGRGILHVWRSKLRGSRQLRDLKKAMPGPVEPLHRIPSPEGGFFNDLYLYNVGEARHSED